MAMYRRCAYEIILIIACKREDNSMDIKNLTVHEMLTERICTNVFVSDGEVLRREYSHSRSHPRLRETRKRQTPEAFSAQSAWFITNELTRMTVAGIVSHLNRVQICNG